MTTQLYFHQACVEHDPGRGHPECPERLRAVMQALETEPFSDLHRIEAPVLDLSVIENTHGHDYVETIMDNVPTEGRVYLDPDTSMSPKSAEAALRAAGGACAAVDAVLSGEARNAFCAVRPPGHHAEASQAMGFCLFNTVAVAARHARQAEGIEKVAVVDFDVHHGNGTQHSFQNDANLFYASSHQWPAYPGTGAAHDTGVADNICNLPLEPGEVPMMRKVRFRTLGCYPLTGAIESEADTLPAIIQEMLLTKTSERQGRVIDNDSAASMEKKKQEGYF